MSVQEFPPMNDRKFLGVVGNVAELRELLDELPPTMSVFVDGMYPEFWAETDLDGKTTLDIYPRTN